MDKRTDEQTNQPRNKWTNVRMSEQTKKPVRQIIPGVQYEVQKTTNKYGKSRAWTKFGKIGGSVHEGSVPPTQLLPKNSPLGPQKVKNIP